MGNEGSTMEHDMMRGGFSWRRLIVWTTAGLLAMVIMMTAVHGFDPFALIVGIPVLVALYLLTRPGKVGPIVVLVVTVALGGLMWWQVFALMGGASSPFDFIPSLLFATSFIFGLIGSIAAIVRNKDLPEGSSGAKTVGIIYAVVVLAGLAYTGYSRASYDSVVAQPGDVTLIAKNLEFNTEKISTDAGQVTVHVTNDDNVLHTFTIDELGVDLSIPGKAGGRITFDAPAGQYKFYCGPHSDVMKGTMEVE